MTVRRCQAVYSIAEDGGMRRVSRCLNRGIMRSDGRVLCWLHATEENVEDCVENHKPKFGFGEESSDSCRRFVRHAGSTWYVDHINGLLSSSSIVLKSVCGNNVERLRGIDIDRNLLWDAITALAPTDPYAAPPELWTVIRRAFMCKINVAEKVFNHTGHKLLWHWLMLHPWNSKSDWPGWSITHYVENRCYACAAVTDKDGHAECRACPLQWPGTRCCDSWGGLFYKWENADVFSRAYYAWKIKNLPVHKDWVGTVI